MKLSAITLTLVLQANAHRRGASAFRAGSDGPNNDMMKKAVEGALRTEVKPLVDIVSPPLRNQILGTEAPVSLGIVPRQLPLFLVPPPRSIRIASLLSSLYSVYLNTGRGLTFIRLATWDLAERCMPP